MSDSANSNLVDTVRRAIPVLIGSLVVLWVYAETLGAPFLWDDKPLLESPEVQELVLPWKYLTTPFWNPIDERARLFYRPIITFSLAVDHALHGSNAAGFHLTNLLLHLGCLGLVYTLAKRYGASRLAAAIAATLWGLLPRFTENVAWISGRTDLLCALFTLAAWSYYRAGDSRRVFGASVFAFLALLSKEAGIAAAAAIAMSELYRQPAPRTFLRLLPLAGFVGAYAALRAVSLAGSEPRAIPLTAVERIWTILEAIGRYAFMVVDPWHPNSQIGIVKVPDFKFVVFGVLMLASLAGWYLWFRRKGQPGARLSGDAIFILVVASVPLLLVIHIIPMPWQVVTADRFLYLPLAAIAVIVAPALDRVVPKRRGFVLGLAGLSVSLALTTRSKAALYTNSAEFWVHAVETTPHQNWYPSLNIAAELVREGFFAEALRVIESVERRPDQIGIQRSVNPTYIAALAGLGRYSEALALLEPYLQRSKNPELGLVRARLLANQARIQEAVEAAQHLVERHPDYGDAWSFLKQMERTKRQMQKSDATTELEHMVRKARIQTLLGRRPQASAAWLSVLASPGCSEGALEEGMAFLVNFGSYEDLRRGLRFYKQRGEGSNVLDLAIEERQRAAQELEKRKPRIERALGISLDG